MTGETVTLHRHAAGGTDAHGNTTYTYTDETVEGAAVAPRQGEETGNNRDTAIVGLTVYLTHEVEMSPLDQMTVRGVRYSIVGEPGLWVSPHTGVTRGVQVALERIEG
ncbi:MAG: hypothetical protein KY469_10765 [Actinobacteria bacterium]|nr:hypothetical protein [Actinomycetota bacterium]